MEFKAGQPAVSDYRRIGYSSARDGMEFKPTQSSVADLVQVLLNNIQLNLIKFSYIELGWAPELLCSSFVRYNSQALVGISKLTGKPQ